LGGQQGAESLDRRGGLGRRIAHEQVSLDSFLIAELLAQAGHIAPEPREFGLLLPQAGQLGGVAFKLGEARVFLAQRLQLGRRLRQRAFSSARRRLAQYCRTMQIDRHANTTAARAAVLSCSRAKRILPARPMERRKRKSCGVGDSFTAGRKTYPTETYPRKTNITETYSTMRPNSVERLKSAPLPGQGCPARYIPAGLGTNFEI